MPPTMAAGVLHTPWKIEGLAFKLVHDPESLLLAIVPPGSEGAWVRARTGWLGQEKSQLCRERWAQFVSTNPEVA